MDISRLLQVLETTKVEPLNNGHTLDPEYFLLYERFVLFWRLFLYECIIQISPLSECPFIGCFTVNAYQRNCKMELECSEVISALPDTHSAVIRPWRGNNHTIVVRYIAYVDT